MTRLVPSHGRAPALTLALLLGPALPGLAQEAGDGTAPVQTQSLVVADDGEYHTPLAGQPLRTEIFGESIAIEARVRTSARTGVEMEALVAVSAAGLTLYDMCKSIDKAMVLGDVRLVRKTGGKSGLYERPGG